MLCQERLDVDAVDWGAAVVSPRAAERDGPAQAAPLHRARRRGTLCGRHQPGDSGDSQQPGPDLAPQGCRKTTKPRVEDFCQCSGARPHHRDCRCGPRLLTWQGSAITSDRVCTSRTLFGSCRNRVRRRTLVPPAIKSRHSIPVVRVASHAPVRIGRGSGRGRAN